MASNSIEAPWGRVSRGKDEDNKEEAASEGPWRLCKDQLWPELATPGGFSRGETGSHFTIDRLRNAALQTSPSEQPTGMK